jgi:hypothetical protein
MFEPLKEKSRAQKNIEHRSREYTRFPSDRGNEQVLERAEGLEHASPRQIMEYCQQALPKLEDAFRVWMTYAPPGLKAEIQRDYIGTRQVILTISYWRNLSFRLPSLCNNQPQQGTSRPPATSE